MGATWPREADGRLRACGLELQVTVPPGVAVGTQDVVTLTAALTWQNNAPVSEGRTLQDRTTLTDPGFLNLVKRVRNVTQQSDFAAAIQG